MKTNDPQQLLTSLFVELFQTEQSAASHCRREAERLGATPPAEALNAVADHAQAQLSALETLAKARQVELTSLGTTLGKVFSTARDLIADRALSRERSYRMTLLGTRHGVDTVKMLRAVAHAIADRDLFIFSEQWLHERQPLVTAIGQQLDWFADHQDVALENSKHGTPLELLGRFLSPA